MTCFLLKNIKNTKKYTRICRLVVCCGKVPTDDRSAGLLIGDSALLQYYGESRTRSRNSTIIQVTGLVFFVFVFIQCMSKELEC